MSDEPPITRASGRGSKRPITTYPPYNAMPPQPSHGEAEDSGVQEGLEIIQHGVTEILEPEQSRSGISVARASGQVSEVKALGHDPRDLVAVDRAWLSGVFEELERIRRNQADAPHRPNEAEHLEGLLRAVFGEKKEKAGSFPKKILGVDFESHGEINFEYGNIHPDILESGNKHETNIDSSSQLNPDKSLEARLRDLEDYVVSTGGAGVAQYVLKLFPELHSLAKSEPSNKAMLVEPSAEQPPPLPEIAPIKWKDREPGETAPDFARRVYGPWLKDGMSKRALRKLDAALLNELNAWVRNGNDMPADIKLLSVGEENRRLLDAGPEAIREHLGKFTGAEAARETERLRQAKWRVRGD